MSLSERLRPAVECASWVYDEVRHLEAERDQLRAENESLRKALGEARPYVSDKLEEYKDSDYPECEEILRGILGRIDTALAAKGEK